MNWCILIPLLVGALCALLGYLLGRLLGKEQNNQMDGDVYKNRISQLESDLAACRSGKSTGSSLASSLVGETMGIPFDADSAKEAFGRKIKENDLKIIEGVGPKIEQLFHNSNVTTWQSLANCSIEKCQDILNSGGERYKIHNPGTWPKQAEMAFQGKWKELFVWQEELDGGK